MINTGFTVTDKCPYFKKLTISLELDITQIYEKYEPIIYVLIAWAVIFTSAKVLKLEKYGVEIKPYSLVYKNKGVNEVLIKILAKTKPVISAYANVSVIAGFIMMAFAFYFLLDNISNYFVAPLAFSPLTLIIPGVTLVTAGPLVYFLLSIPIVLVMHEGGHGIVAALEKIKIKTGGFAIFIPRFAGFVEPDEEEFEKAKKISKLRVIGAGATSNVLFAIVLGFILLSNPVFPMMLEGIPLFGEPIISMFYETLGNSEGVKVVGIIENSGAEQAGLLENDIITSVNDIPIGESGAFPNLTPGDTVTVSVIRDAQPLDFELEIMPSPDDPEKGLVGIMRDNSLAGYKPVMNFIDWSNAGEHVHMFLMWLWMISFFIGIINMLPLPILDGGKFIQIIIDKRFSDKVVKNTMWVIYAITFIVFGLNIALTVEKFGFLQI